MVTLLSNYRHYIKFIFVIVLVLWFCSWAFSITPNVYSSNSGPDEGLRMLVPTYIYAHHSLPNGYEHEVIYTKGNWSYAFYPQLLGAIISAGFMGIGGVLSHTDSTLLYSARLTSVLFGTIAVLAFGGTIKKIFQGRKHATAYSYLAMVLLAFWPQFAFLSAYVNNDIVALAGVSLILYGCVLGIRDGWNYKGVVILALGFIICLLGYSNSLGFVLCAGIFFLITMFRQNHTTAYSLRMLALLCLLPLIVAGPFFVRNAILYNGDFLGVKTFGERTIAWEKSHGERIQTSYLDTGRTLKNFVKDKPYWTEVEQSFIGKFGYMTISPARSLLLIYKLIIVLGGIGFLVLTITIIWKRRVKQHTNDILYVLFLMASSVITLTLSVYYTLTIDIQSQGRYIIYILLPLLILSVIGIQFLIRRIPKIQLPIIVMIALAYATNTYIIFSHYIR